MSAVRVESCLVARILLMRMASICLKPTAGAATWMAKVARATDQASQGATTCGFVARASADRPSARFATIEPTERMPQTRADRKAPG